MNTQKVNISKILPVLMAFFVMSFVDLVGIGVDRVSKDMNLSSTLAQLIPSAAFLWFLLLSVPVGVMQSRLGKRFMLNIGMVLRPWDYLFPISSTLLKWCSQALHCLESGIQLCRYQQTLYWWMWFPETGHQAS